MIRKKEMVFNTGEQERFNRWNLEKGAAEFKDEQVFLTSLPKNQGIIRLKKQFALSQFADRYGAYGQ